MFKKVILAIEFYRGEEYLVRCLPELRRLGMQECLLVQSVDPQLQFADPENPLPDLSSAILDLAKNNLKRQQDRLLSLGLRTDTRLVHLDLSQELERIAREESYDLIVVGAEKHTLVGQMLFGGIAHDVIHRAPKPVLQVRIFSPGAKKEAALQQNLLDHVLFPTDFSENAALAFETLKGLVERGVKHLTLAHIQDRSRIDPYLADQLDSFNQKDRERLEEMRAELLALGDVDVNLHLGYGSPTSELLSLVKKSHVSLVLMGSQGRGYIKELYLGSVSHNMARHAEASVLLVPAKRDL